MGHPSKSRRRRYKDMLGRRRYRQRDNISLLNRRLLSAIVVAECLWLPIMVGLALFKPSLMAQVNRFNVALFGALCIWAGIFFLLSAFLHIAGYELKPGNGPHTWMPIGCLPYVMMAFGGMLLFFAWSASLQSFLSPRLDTVAVLTPALLICAAFGVYNSTREVFRAIKHRIQSHADEPAQSGWQPLSPAEIRRRRRRMRR